jgi:hypothetical protein
MLRSQQAWNNSNKYSFIGGEFKASHAEHSSLFIIAFVFLCIGVSSFLIFLEHCWYWRGKEEHKRKTLPTGWLGVLLLYKNLLLSLIVLYNARWVNYGFLGDPSFF